MTRNGAALACYDIAIPVVAADGAHKYAAFFMKPPKKVAPLHASSMTPDRREAVEGISPAAIIASIPSRSPRSMERN